MPSRNCWRESEQVVIGSQHHQQEELSRPSKTKPAVHENSVWLCGPLTAPRILSIWLLAWDSVWCLAEQHYSVSTVDAVQVLGMDAEQRCVVGICSGGWRKGVTHSVQNGEASQSQNRPSGEVHSVHGVQAGGGLAPGIGALLAMPSIPLGSFMPWLFFSSAGVCFVGRRGGGAGFLRRYATRIMGRA